VTSINVFTESLGIEFLGVSVIANKTLLVMRDVKTTVKGTFESSKDLGTGRSTLQASIEESHEGAGTFISGIDIVVFTNIFGVTLVDLIKTEFLENTAGEEETSSVSSTVVSEASLESVTRELMGVGSTNNDITSHCCVSNLAYYITVGETDDEAVLGGVVLVLVLGGQPQASTVVGLSGTATTVLDLQFEKYIKVRRLVGWLID
jgi:hypothetical protein